MATYEVKIPFAGYVIATVDAVGEDQAKDRAYELSGFSISFDHPDDADVGEVEMMDEITRGNVCSAPLNSISIEKVEDQ